MNMRTVAILSVVLAACATVRIDVDAYVGPLANTEEVQLQQTMAMAIGAKPLLVQLRDELEAQARTPWVHGPQRLSDLRRLREYDAEWINTEGATKPWFQSTHAERINSVLHLYRDLEDPLVAALHAEVRQYQGLYERVGSIGNEREIDERLWLDLAPHLRAGAREAIEGYLHPPGSGNQAVLRDARGLLRFARQQLDGSVCRALYITLRSETGSEVRLRLADIRPLEGNSNGEPYWPLGANVAFDFLSQHDLWMALTAKVLEPGRADLAARLAARGTQVAIAFRDARESLRRMFVLAVDLARARIDKKMKDGMTAEEAVDSLVVVTSLLGKTNMEVVQQIKVTNEGDAIPLGTRFDSLIPLVCGPFAHRRDGDQSLRHRLTETFGARGAGSPQDLAELARVYLDAVVLLDELSREPAAEFAEGWWGPSDLESLLPCRPDLQKAVARSKRMYGIVGGPTIEGPAGSVARQTRAEDLAQVTRTLVGENGLASGRLAEGIDSLVTTYLEASRRGASEYDLRPHRRVLLSSLAQFAEKLRVMSSLQGLIGEEVRAYVDVLSAIANSILLQIDSLQRSDQVLAGTAEEPPSDADRRAAQVELQAWSRAFCDSEEGQSAYGLKIPSAKCATASESPELVLDQLLARLRYLHVDVALRHGHDSAQSKRVRDAIDLAHEHRTGFAFLRPAFEYLRSSSPATSLQQIPLLLTDRILGNATPNKNRESRASAIELDKQYWRNVNSVVVDGVGKTQYVIAKDDIGNWQVKSVSNDVTDLMKTLGGLASFGLGGGVSPLAKLEAASYANLVEKARNGTLEEPDRAKIEELRAAERESVNRDGLLKAHVDIAVQATDELLLQMRDKKWLKALEDELVGKTGSDDEEEVMAAIEAAWQPPPRISGQADTGARNRLRASRTHYEQVAQYWRKDAAGAARKALEDNSLTNTIDVVMGIYEGRLTAKLREHAAARQQVLARLRASLHVLATPTPATDTADK